LETINKNWERKVEQEGGTEKGKTRTGSVRGVEKKKNPYRVSVT
jgi:hypothetical protein